MAQGIHELKCWPVWFEAMWAGDKVAEVRKDDREYRAGDKLIIHEFHPAEREVAGAYTGRRIEAAITHVLPLKSVPGIEVHDARHIEWVVLSLRITWRESRP